MDATITTKTALDRYQQARLDQARRALEASRADDGNPSTYARHLGAVEVNLGDMIRLVEALAGE